MRDAESERDIRNSYEYPASEMRPVVGSWVVSTL
jgi:hypothetical protein